MDESTQEMAEAKEQDEKVVKIAERLGIDAATLQIYRNVFGLLDLDESGTVEEKELKIGLASIGCRPTETELRAMMDQVDDNYSGEIEMSEFIKFMVRDWFAVT